MKNHDGLWKCSRQCMQHKNACSENGCKYWIDYKDDYNCTLIAIYEHGRMTLRQVADRLGISFARVKQIESAALLKIKKRCNKNDVIF